VQVSVAEEWARGEVAARVRRVRRLGGKRFLSCLLVECADVGSCGLLGGARRYCKAGGQKNGKVCSVSSFTVTSLIILGIWLSSLERLCSRRSKNK
jgi:hypothetical protein